MEILAQGGKLPSTETGGHFDVGLNPPNAVAMEIASTLNFCGVPKTEHDEFMAIIEVYRPQVVQA